MNEQIILHERYMSQSRRFVLEIRISITGGQLTTSINVNKEMQSENITYLGMLYNDEIIIPVTDRTKIGEINKKIIEVNGAINKFFSDAETTD